MSTRQVASLLAAAAPEVVPPRDTLRAAAPDRYTLKVSIDQECEQGLRLLKDLMSHVDPRMSWGHLVARLVRDAVARHDPRGGARGQRRRRSAGSAGASPRRAPIKTRAAGAEAGPVQPVGETSGRAPNKTRAAMTPAAPARRGGGGTPAPKGDTAATAGQNPVAMLASAAAPQQSAPAALADGALAGGVPSAAPAATAAPQFAGGVSADGSNAGAGVPVSPGATSAPQLAADVSVDGSHPGAGAQVSPVATSAPQSAAGASVDGSHPGAGAPISPGATSAPQPAAGASADGSHPIPAQVHHGSRRVSPLRRRIRQPAPRRMVPIPAQVHRSRRAPLRRRSRHSAGPLTAGRPAPQPEQRRTRPANRFTAATTPRRAATFPRRSGATSGYATVDAAVIAIRSPGAAAPRPICCRSTTCRPSPRAVARSRRTSISCAQLITECATATDRRLRRSPRCSASSALLARRSTAQADSLQVARRGYASQPREPSVHLRYRLFRPWPVAVDALMQGAVVVSRLRFPAASGVRTRCPRCQGPIADCTCCTVSFCTRCPWTPTSGQPHSHGSPSKPPSTAT